MVLDRIHVVSMKNYVILYAKRNEPGNEIRSLVLNRLKK